MTCSSWCPRVLWRSLHTCVRQRGCHAQEQEWHARARTDTAHAHTHTEAAPAFLPLGFQAEPRKLQHAVLALLVLGDHKLAYHDGSCKETHQRMSCGSSVVSGTFRDSGRTQEGSTLGSHDFGFKLCTFQLVV